MSTSKMLEKINDAVEEAIRPILGKGAAMTAAELDVLTKAVCTIEKIKQIEDAENSYSDNSYGDGGNSYRRGRSTTTGRYISRDAVPHFDGGTSRRFYDGGGYSGHSIKDRMVAQLEKMYDEAQSEHERQTVSDWIRRLETN